MFTGIIHTLGTTTRVEYRGATARIEIETELDISDVGIGDSIAVNGVCLTVVEFALGPIGRLMFDIGPETVEKTTLASLRPMQMVHLEKALTFSGRIHGHLVQGHVDGTGIVLQKAYEGQALRLRIACERSILKLCVVKGSITMNGVSLTLNQVNESSFEVCLIPLTLEKTLFAKLEVGDRVNLESDLIGKYLQHFATNLTSAEDGLKA